MVWKIDKKSILDFLKQSCDFIGEKLLAKSIERLGGLGLASFIASIKFLNEASKVSYTTEPYKGIVIIISGILLLLFSGWIYYLNSKEKTLIVHGALNSLTQVFQRIPEQVDKTENNEEIMTLMNAIKGYPDKIINLIKDVETKT